MGVLEQITQMKNQGIPDDEIVSSLQEQGASPKEINDALSQSQIKNAVAGEEEMYGQPPAPEQQYQEMPELPQADQETYAPQSQGYDQPQETYAQDNYGGYPSETGMDSNTMIEIAEQVFSEKIKKIQKQTDILSEFRTLGISQIENVSERLKRMETTIDKLQIAILDKVGSYGDNLNSIKKEMSMMQDSFGKVVNQAVKGHHAHKTTKTSKKK
jgi:hypothetical protein